MVFALTMSHWLLRTPLTSPCLVAWHISIYLATHEIAARAACVGGSTLLRLGDSGLRLLRHHGARQSEQHGKSKCLEHRHTLPVVKLARRVPRESCPAR